MSWRFWRRKYAGKYKGRKSIQVMKQEINTMLQNFRWEDYDKPTHESFLKELKEKLEEYRQIRGR